MNYLPSRPQKSQCNFSSSVCCCNNISCSTCHWPILENMSMGYYCNKPIYVTSHIAATNPKKPERTFIFHTYRFFFSTLNSYKHKKLTSLIYHLLPTMSHHLTVVRSDKQCCLLKCKSEMQHPSRSSSWHFCTHSQFAYSHNQIT